MILFRRFYVLGKLSIAGSRIIGYFTNFYNGPVNRYPDDRWTKDISKAVKYITKEEAELGIREIENEFYHDKLSVIHCPGMVTVKRNPPERYRGPYDFVEYTPLAQLD